MSLDTPNAESSPLQSNQFRFVVNTLLEHWRLIFVGSVIGCLMFGVAAFLRREIAVVNYQAHVDITLMPSQWEDEILKGVSGLSLATTPKSLVERTSKRALAEETALALVQRDIVKGGDWSRIATRDELKAASSGLEGRISLAAVDSSEKIRIEANYCQTPQEAEDIAEFAARVFVEQNRQIAMDKGKETHSFVNKTLTDLQRQLFAAETAEWEFKRKMGFRVFGNLDEEMSKMYKDLNETRVTRDEIQAKLNQLDAGLKANTEQLPETLSQVTDSVVDQLFRELDELLQKQLSMSAVYQPEFPGLKEIKEEIAEKQNTIQIALQQLDAGAAGGSTVWRQRQEIYRQRMDLRLRLTELDIRAAALERMLHDITPQIPELANKNLEYEKLVQETKSLRERFDKLRQREWEIRTAISQGAGQLERFDPVSKASVMPMGMGSKQLWINFVIGAIAGFVFSFCLAMMWEANDTSIRSIEDVKEYIGLEVIGTIPEMRFGSPRGGRRRRATYVTTVDEEQVDACIVTLHDPKSPISEAYRTLRTNYQFATINQKPKTLMVTSAVPGEGKTTTAANIAVTMADRGMRVLIVDTDLRRPNVHRVFRMERGPGLADVLREGLDIQSVIRPTRVQNLWIISSGRVPPNPSELIASEGMAEVMEQLGSQFDLVICDAPSVLVVTDPVLLATHVETCIMVVSTNNARRETVIRANKLLETAKVNVVGVVLNGLETTRRHYYYYYYYYEDGTPIRRKWYHFY